MNIFIGADHGGFELKQKIVRWLQQNQYPVEDVEPSSQNPCDYPLIAQKVALHVQKNNQHLGILICTSGIGMCITANKFKNVRAALVHTPEVTQKAREHNHINMLCLAGTLDADIAYLIVQKCLMAVPSMELRHLRRLKQIQDIEYLQ
ncbi:MAG: RpiB/LacA/LacB family sugar-phosphate isomerase [Puniceicoccales bacterium]|jgi:ribose 5-phosphate isomerase B|nr:RpiB/LacA/LacB family sugar-phosphate isomerase [Puniceicoccales bacterium]